MPERELIHSSADVLRLLSYAFDSGMHVMMDEPQPEPRPRFFTRSEIGGVTRGSFSLVRPEWIFGPFQTMIISEGRNCGKYFLQPRVNFAQISIFFNGERIDDGRRRFGSGVVSYHRDWLELPAKVLRRTPTQVGLWFKRVVAHLISGEVLNASVHRYYICRGVTADAAAAQTLPPFDFIPWPPVSFDSRLDNT